MNQARVQNPVGRRITTEGRRTLALCLGAAALICALAVLHTWTRIGVIQRGYALAKAKSEKERLEREIVKYSLEIETRQNAATVDREAHARLGMEKASRILVLKSSEMAQRPVVTRTALAKNGL